MNKSGNGTGIVLQIAHVNFLHVAILDDSAERRYVNILCVYTLHIMYPGLVYNAR